MVVSPNSRLESNQGEEDASHLSRTETRGVPSWGVATVVTDSTQDALVPPLQGRKQVTVQGSECRGQGERAGFRDSNAE